MSRGAFFQMTGFVLLVDWPLRAYSKLGRMPDGKGFRGAKQLMAVLYLDPSIEHPKHNTPQFMTVSLKSQFTGLARKFP